MDERGGGLAPVNQHFLRRHFLTPTNGSSLLPLYHSLIQAPLLHPSPLLHSPPSFTLPLPFSPPSHSGQSTHCCHFIIPSLFFNLHLPSRLHPTQSFSPPSQMAPWPSIVPYSSSPALPLKGQGCSSTKNRDWDSQERKGGEREDAKRKI